MSEIKKLDNINIDWAIKSNSCFESSRYLAKFSMAILNISREDFRKDKIKNIFNG